MKKTKKQKYVYVLSVDFGGGDGADYFPLRTGRYHKGDKENVEKNFPQMLWLSEPPPKVEVKRLTQKQWKDACRVGRERY